MSSKLKLKNLAVAAGTLICFTSAPSVSALGLKAGDTNIGIYGYAELNTIYDNNGDLGPVFIPWLLRLDGVDGPDNNFQMHAFESRLGVSTSTPTQSGSDIKTVVEADFFGNGGGTLRLRQAYGEWNGILAGQAWTNFPGFTAIYPTVDFAGPVASTNTRQAQLRYTTGLFSIALEEPGNLGGTVTSGIIPGVGLPNTAGGAYNGAPDLTVRFSNRGPTSYHISTVVRHLSYDNNVNDDSALGWGVSLGLSQKLTETLTARVSITHGDGIGGYLNYNPGAPAYIDPTSGSLETVSATGGNASLSLKAGPGSLTLAVGMAEADWDDAQSASLPNIGEANKMFRSTHLNYIWSPMKNVSYGLEMAYHERELQDGREGDAVRFQGMAKYSF